MTGCRGCGVGFSKGTAKETVVGSKLVDIALPYLLEFMGHKLRSRCRALRPTLADAIANSVAESERGASGRQ